MTDLPLGRRVLVTIPAQTFEATAGIRGCVFDDPYTWTPMFLARLNATVEAVPPPLPPEPPVGSAWMDPDGVIFRHSREYPGSWLFPAGGYITWPEVYARGGTLLGPVDWPPADGGAS